MAASSSKTENATNANTTSQGDGGLETMERQIAKLRREIGKINRTLAEQAEGAADEVSGWYESAADRAARAATALRTQAKGVSGAVKENPGTVSTAMLIGGALGLMIGLMLNQQRVRGYGWFDRR